jgi:hypothetical protein
MTVLRKELDEKHKQAIGNNQIKLDYNWDHQLAKVGL